MEESLTVWVSVPGGPEHHMAMGSGLVFGRSRHADLVVRGDPGLSRLAGRIDVTGEGVRISNLSASHSLVTVICGQVSLLPPAPAQDSGVLLVTAGRAQAGSPYMHSGGSMVTVCVEGAFSPPSADLPEVDEETETATRIRVDSRTKEFVTALMLCRDWLVDPSRSSALPTSAAIAREALAATHTWDQLTRFDAGRADVRARVTRRVDEHLRHLKTKLEASGVLPEGTRVTKALLAHQLVALQVLVPAHLRLLEDEDWLADQAELWWDA